MFLYIPALLTDGAVNAGGAGGSMLDGVATFFQFIFLIAIFVGIVYMAYFSTRWIARARNSISGTNIKVIESAAVGQQGTVQIVRAGNEYFLIGVTKENISLISKIDEEGIDFSLNKAQANVPFDKYYDKYVKKFFKKQ